MNALLNFLCIRKEYKTLLSKSDILNIVKMGALSVAMALVMYGVCKILSNFLVLGLVGGITICAVCGILGLLVYGALCYFTKVDILFSFMKEKK